LNWDKTKTEVEPENLYLVEGIEQFQSPDFVPQSWETQEDSHGNQSEEGNLKVNEATTSLPLNNPLSPIAVSGNTKGNVEEGEINISQRRSPLNSFSSSSSSNPPIPPSSPIQNLENLELMAQPQRLLNIAPFPYFMEDMGMIQMHMWIGF
jgi:hypothetical protein